MILIDVAVPSVESTYDFKIDENALVTDVIREIVEMICQKERCSISDASKDFLLCRSDTGMPLDKNRSLFDLQINSGQKLILV